jgi:hypothetical protein
MVKRKFEDDVDAPMPQVCRVHFLATHPYSRRLTRITRLQSFKRPSYATKPVNLPSISLDVDMGMNVTQPQYNFTPAATEPSSSPYAYPSEFGVQPTQVGRNRLRHV